MRNLLSEYYMLYDLKQHKHQYAIWTAARAVQRSFTKTLKISHVINKSSLRQFVDCEIALSDQNQFDSLQKKWCYEIIKDFEVLNVTATYGQAAKIVAIYLKTSVVMGADPTNEYLKFIHPPIDRIILKNLPRIESFKQVKKISWTKMDEGTYWEVVQRIRQQFNFFDWRLEMLWTPEQALD